jgi:hypothetical protein
MPCLINPSIISQTLRPQEGLQTRYEEASGDSGWADLIEFYLSNPEGFYRSFSGVSPDQAPGGDTEIGGKEADEDFDIVDEVYVFLTQDEAYADVILQLEPKHWKVRD